MTWQVDALQRAVAPVLPGLVVEVLATVDSTNSELMRRARAGNMQPVLLVAEVQTAGRGRQGRAWHSDLGDSLMFSLGMPLAPRSWSGLSLAVGVSVAESLDPCSSAGIGLKWPNDLWVSRPGADCKLAGILVETAAGVSGVAGAGLADAGHSNGHSNNTGTGNIHSNGTVPVLGSPRYAVIGVGINIAPRSGTGMAVRPVGLLELAGLGTGSGGISGGNSDDSPCETDAPQLLCRILPALVAAVQGFEALGFAPFQARFDARDVLRDRAVVLSDGTAGTAHGVDENGGLLVHTALGMQTITLCEVSVRPLAPLLD